MKQTAEEWLKKNRPWDGVTPIGISLHEVAGMLEEYASQQDQSEAKERYERAAKFLSRETYMNGEFNRINIALKIASGFTDKPQKS